MSNIIIVVEGGCVQNILVDKKIKDNVFLVDYDDIQEGGRYDELDSLMVLNMNHNIQIDKDEVKKLLSMTNRKFLQENDPHFLEFLEKELHEK